MSRNGIWELSWGPTVLGAVCQARCEHATHAGAVLSLASTDTCDSSRQPAQKPFRHGVGVFTAIGPLLLPLLPAGAVHPGAGGAGFGREQTMRSTTIYNEDSPR